MPPLSRRTARRSGAPWARGPKGERVEGRGTSPQDALQQLTVHLTGVEPVTAFPTI